MRKAGNFFLAFCLIFLPWERQALDHMIEVISRILKANYGWPGMDYIFSKTFLKVQDKVRE